MSTTKNEILSRQTTELTWQRILGNNGNQLRILITVFLFQQTAVIGDTSEHWELLILYCSCCFSLQTNNFAEKNECCYWGTLSTNQPQALLLSKYITYGSGVFIAVSNGAKSIKKSTKNARVIVENIVTPFLSEHGVVTLCTRKQIIQVMYVGNEVNDKQLKQSGCVAARPGETLVIRRLHASTAWCSLKFQYLHSVATVVLQFTQCRINASILQIRWVVTVSKTRKCHMYNHICCWNKMITSNY